MLPPRGWEDWPTLSGFAARAEPSGWRHDHITRRTVAGVVNRAHESAWPESGRSPNWRSTTFTRPLPTLGTASNGMGRSASSAPPGGRLSGWPDGWRSRSGATLRAGRAGLACPWRVSLSRCAGRCRHDHPDRRPIRARHRAPSRARQGRWHRHRHAATTAGRRDIRITVWRDYAATRISGLRR